MSSSKSPKASLVPGTDRDLQSHPGGGPSWSHPCPGGGSYQAASFPRDRRVETRGRDQPRGNVLTTVTVALLLTSTRSRLKLGDDYETAATALRNSSPWDLLTKGMNALLLRES